MLVRTSLTLTGAQHTALRSHLFPGDGLEAVAILLCGRRTGARRHRLLVRRMIPVPHHRCARSADRVTWPTDILPALLTEAAAKGWALVKVHGHVAYDRFSAVDDLADHTLFPSIHAWIDDGAPHASAIMMDDGRMFGRAFWPEGRQAPLESVNLVDDDLSLWRDAARPRAASVPAHAHRLAQSFGSGTYALLQGLKVGVVGCSGTGSPVIEQLARNCVGSLVLVDPDHIEDKNLNRILNSRKADVRVARRKVEIARRTIRGLGFGTKVEIFASTLFERPVVEALADCDILFGCMDSIDGRHLLNKLAAFYLIPYFDLGVKIEADGEGGVDQVCGSVHYLKPDGSSLLSRGVYTMEQVRAAGLARTDPPGFREQLAAGYVRGVAEDRPAVIQLNMLIASLAVNEMLARLHPYRLEPSGDYAAHRISLSHGIFTHEGDGEACTVLARHSGRGDVSPLLDWPELSSRKAEVA